ncbi:MAG: T9SS type A sorting domain-containing protein [Bacteroidetes bacterium]|nr:T9SS type A sorting domain-containing protein [Bacteroidota bacterium]
MKKFLLLVTSLFSFYSQAQVVNQITIIPSNPTSSDTISVITNFSYYGDCSFGLVGYYYYLQDSTIYILPTYCGYGATTLCTSIDTLKLETFPAENYIISIEFHQGSVCPFSHFDATIAQFDTTLTINTTSGLISPNVSESEILLFPNPTNGKVTLRLEKGNLKSVSLYNSLGVLIDEFFSSTFSMERFPSGIYWTTIKTDRGQSTLKIMKH